MSRSTRVTSTHEPKISARSATPKAKVKGQLEISLNPWLSSKLTRYALNDHFFAGSTSPVGTFQRPVSPMNVVVAGRVWTSPDAVPDVIVVVLVWLDCFSAFFSAFSAFFYCSVAVWVVWLVVALDGCWAAALAA